MGNTSSAGTRLLSAGPRFLMDATVDSNEDEEVPAEPPRKQMWAHPRLYTPSTRHRPVGKVTSRGGAIRRTSTTTSIPSGSACRRRWPVAVDIFGAQHHHSRHGGGGERGAWGGALFPTTDLNATLLSDFTSITYIPTPTCETKRDQFLPIEWLEIAILWTEGCKVGEGQDTTPPTRWRKVGLRQLRDWAMGKDGTCGCCGE